MAEKNENTKMVCSYNDAKGTGVLSTLIFAVIVIAAMFVIAYLKG